MSRMYFFSVIKNYHTSNDCENTCAHAAFGAPGVEVRRGGGKQLTWLGRFHLSSFASHDQEAIPSQRRGSSQSFHGYGCFHMEKACWTQMCLDLWMQCLGSPRQCSSRLFWPAEAPTNHRSTHLPETEATVKFMEMVKEFFFDSTGKFIEKL